MPRIILGILLIAFFSLSHTGHSSAQPARKENKETASSANVKRVLYGLASYYADKFHGRQTATGEIFSQDKITAACNVLPLGTWLRVTNLKNGKSIRVKTNDRLHPKTRRIIDLSKEAASRLGYIRQGLTRVKIEVLGTNISMVTDSGY